MAPQAILTSDLVSSLEVGDVVGSEIVDRGMKDFAAIYPKCKEEVVMLGEKYGFADSYITFRYIEWEGMRKFVEYLGVHSISDFN